MINLFFFCLGFTLRSRMTAREGFCALFDQKLASDLGSVAQLPGISIVEEAGPEVQTNLGPYSGPRPVPVC